jgi:Protein of unknown function (DUF559)
VGGESVQQQDAPDSNHTLRDRARDLRKNMTDAERHLWSRLRQRQLLATSFADKFRSNITLPISCAWRSDLLSSLTVGNITLRRM